ncbi:MAG: phosphatidylserine decarboxylase [Candidatus Eremiobacterota bacterium]
MNQTLHFLNQVQGGDPGIGAIAPTSRHAATALAEECARHLGPKSVLELGSGTGAITTHILPTIGPRDRLVLCEIHPEFVKFLRHRMQTEARFQALEGRVTLQAVSAAELEGEAEYDYILCSIPFTILPADLARAIFERARRLLKPGGIFSYIEYAWLRGLRRPFSGKKFREVDRVLEEYIRTYQVARRTVLQNLPPAWIRHLRFQQGPASRALDLAPLEHRHRVQILGEWGVAREAVLQAAGMLGLAGLALAIPPLAHLWQVPALAAGIVSTFLRDPYRQVRRNAQVAYSACDGRVLKVERVTDARLGEGEWLRIATFLGVHDVHINRAPVAGKVIDQFGRSGGYAPAYDPKADHNHSVYTLIEGPCGRCAVAQRVGVLARRIVNWFQVGDLLAQGERYGLIRLGSRTDVYLPAGQVQEVLVKPGDRVTGGVTPIARFACEPTR